MFRCISRSSLLLALFLFLAIPSRSDDAGWTSLVNGKDLSAWAGPTGDWLIAGGVEIDPKNPKRLVATPGSGVLVNGPKGGAPDLLSKQEYGDVEIHLEFFIPKGSNSGIKFEGLYEIQIFDSHGVKDPSGSDCGGIYPRAELKPNYHHIDKGIAPRVNAAKPAGEWQTLDAIFLAPRFDADGRKTAPARLVKAVLNGQLIHENVALETPTGHAWKNKEVPAGALLLQGDHGPVAFRDIRVRPYAAKKE